MHMYFLHVDMSSMSPEVIQQFNDPVVNRGMMKVMSNPNIQIAFSIIRSRGNT